jgi:hypothetical protein
MPRECKDCGNWQYPQETNFMGNPCLLPLPSQSSSDELFFKCYEGTWRDIKKLQVILISLNRNTCGKREGEITGTTKKKTTV